MEAGADDRMERLAARRRRRREAERLRIVRARRRRFLVATAVAFALGIGIGASSDGGGDPPIASADVPPAAEVPTISDFHDPLPILMYHAIETPPLDASYPALYVPFAEFKDQMRWLARKGYNAVTMGQVFDAWFDGAEIPENPVVISFDDGIRSQYTHALPALAKRGWPGVLNLEVKSLDEGDIGTDQVEEMIAAGWEIGSHTFTHPDVSTLSGDDLAHEVADSRTELSERLGVPVDFFCYPSGGYDKEAVQGVEDAGYRGATTTDPGLASPDEPFTLKRIRINGGDGTAGLAAALD